MEPVYWSRHILTMSNFFFTPPTLLIQTSTSITGVAKHGSISNAAQWICHTCLLWHKFSASTPPPTFILLILTLSDGVSPALLKRHEYTDGPVCWNKPERFRRILSASVCVYIYLYIIIIFFYLLQKPLKWPSSLSRSRSLSKLPYLPRLKSLLKPRDKSRWARHKSHCQKKASLSPSPLYLRGPLALYLPRVS